MIQFSYWFDYLNYEIIHFHIFQTSQYFHNIFTYKNISRRIHHQRYQILQNFKLQIVIKHLDICAVHMHAKAILT